MENGVFDHHGFKLAFDIDKARVGVVRRWGVRTISPLFDRVFVGNSGKNEESRFEKRLTI